MTGLQGSCGIKIQYIERKRYYATLDIQTNEAHFLIELHDIIPKYLEAT
jgi:hypothetical protein